MKIANVLLAACVTAVSACTSALVSGHPVGAVAATIADSAGKTVATASLWQEASGLVHVDVESIALPPGSHGMHMHSVGNCGSTTGPFSAAMHHFNPLGRKHGLSSPDGPHAGDGPNLVVGPDGRGRVSFTTDRITLLGGPLAALDADGSSLVIHASEDDQRTDTSGNSGARIACGVLRKVS